MKKLKILIVVLILLSWISGCNSKADFEKDEQDLKLEEYATDKYISVNEVDNMIKSEDDLIIFGVIDKTNITVKNIEGAYLVWRNDYSGSGSSELVSDTLTGARFDKEVIENILSKAGATKNSKIVIYSANAHVDAGRFAWQIESLNHKNVRILDGGINAWTGADMETGDATRISDIKAKKSDYRASDYDANLGYADIEMVLEAVKNPNDWIIIDARSDQEFNQYEIKKGGYGGGTIKGSHWIEWTNAVDDETMLKKLEELKSIYGEFEGKKIITLCHSGVKSAFTYELLKNALGYENVYNYDGSWTEWSYVASKASTGVVDDKLREDVIASTSNWVEK
ncbi:MAG: sulfurtransferase [Bacilli bacterium]